MWVVHGFKYIAHLTASMKSKTHVLLLSNLLGFIGESHAVIRFLNAVVYDVIYMCSLLFINY